MKALVTGGAGFIGSNIVERLLQEGHEVIVIDNESSTVHEKFYWDDRCKNYKYDICDYDLIYSLFEGVDIVFHVAAEARIQPAIINPLLTIKTNVLGTANVLQASREHGVKRFIYSTTSSYYGKKNSLPNVEDQTEDCLNVYSISKVSGEKLCKMYFELYGLKTISLRYFNVYGKNEPVKGTYAPVIGLFLKQFKNNKPLTIVGDGTQRRDFTNIKDVVEANMLAAFHDVDDSAFGQEYNIGYGKNYSILDIASMISDTIEFIDERPGEAKETLSDTTKFKKAFGWESTSNLEEWIKNNK